jgi:hypothetical protein
MDMPRKSGDFRYEVILGRRLSSNSAPRLT